MTQSILVVDDSITVRMDLAEAFEAAGFDVIQAASLAEARVAVARAVPSAIVLDVILPDGDGVDFLRDLRTSEPTATVLILMLSTEGEVQDRIRSIRTGADEYVGKPYDRDYVVRRTRELLRRPRAETSPAILVVDDSETYRHGLRDALVDEGYEVVLAASGEEGLARASELRPAAVLVDGVMPGMDGPTVIRKIRLDAALRGVPCILLTGDEDTNVELRAFDAGADAFVRKASEMELILAKLAAVLRTARERPAEARASLVAPKKILAVDDSPTYLHEIADNFQSQGFQVVPARSGEEALELLAVEKVDCILLDLLMPGIGGKETCKRIKATPGIRDIPLILLTSLDDRAAMLDGLSAGADDYVSKASDIEILRARVRAQIRRKQFEDEHRSIREELLQKELEATEARAARQIAEARAAMVEQLEAKNQELEAFSYTVSHDLRAPLRSIDGFSRVLLEDHAGTLDQKGQDYLSRVRAAATRMDGLIDDLLHLSRVGRAELTRTDVDLGAIARQILSDLHNKDPERKVDVRVEDVPPADGDGGLLRAVLENLLGNAWKFTAKSDVQRITFGAETKGTDVVYFVSDTGAGFDMQHAQKLFRPFQRLHAASEFAGTGIGLATVHRIVDRHGGRLWAESQLGKGAVFRFVIPPRTDKPSRSR